MPNATINRVAFKEMLSQFKYDIPYEVELINQILDNMPVQARNKVIEELFMTRVYSGELYKAVHYTFKDDINYFINSTELIKFLKEASLIAMPDEFWDTFDKRSLRNHIEKAIPLAGYIITKEEK